MNVEDRLIRLETDYRRWRASAIALGIALLFTCLLGAAPDDDVGKPNIDAPTVAPLPAAEAAPEPRVEFVGGSVRAQRLELTDSLGETLLTLGADEHGGILMLRDAEHRPAFGIGCGAGNNFVALYNRSGEVVVQLVAHHDRSGGGIEIYNRNHLPVAVMSCTKDNSGTAWVSNANGKPKWVERGGRE